MSEEQGGCGGGGRGQEARVLSGHRTLVSTEHDPVPEVFFVPQASLKLHSIHIKLHCTNSQTVVHTSFKLHSTNSQTVVYTSFKLHSAISQTVVYTSFKLHSIQLSGRTPRIDLVAFHTSLKLHSTSSQVALRTPLKLLSVHLSICTPYVR